MGIRHSTQSNGSADGDDRQVVMLAATVERLRTELEELRGSTRTSAIVEQAKGVLAGRLGVGVDAAYEHLLQLARDSGVTPVAAAALLLGVPQPTGEDRPAPAARRTYEPSFDPTAYLRERPVPQALPGEPVEPTARQRLAIATFDSADSADDLARELCTDVLGWLGARAALLTTLEPDGALRLAGSYGLPPHLTSAWARIPPHPRIAVSRCVSGGRPLWPEQTVHLLGTGDGGARVCSPLSDGRRIFGAVEIIWPEGTPLDQEQRRYLLAVMESCALRLRRLTTDCPVDPTAPWLRAVLDAVPGPAALISPLRDAAGQIIDFRIEACNSDTTDTVGRGSADLTGNRLVETYPGLTLSGLLDAYIRVLETGSPLRMGPEEYATLLDGEMRSATMSVRACRMGDGVLVSWRFHDALDDLAAQLDQAQRLGNLGWSVWNLSTGQTRWSPRLYQMFGRDPLDGPLSLDRLADQVVPEDRRITVHLVRRLLHRREPVDTEVHIRRGGQVCSLRLMAEPVLDPLGEPTAVRCVFQDVTGRRRDERALKASRAQLERQRRRIAEERREAIELQRSILPLPLGIMDKPGLRAAVRYLPAGSSTRVGGDWYETSAIDDAGVFLAIGDVSGHGLQAAAAMARLRNGLSGLAFTGAAPDQLLRWLNQVVLHWPTTLTATVWTGRFDPVDKTLTWAIGGHFPPILVRDGKACALPGPDGVLLGATPEPEFGVETTRLESGDLLLLYTDGLIERRDRDLGDGIDLLIEAATACDSDDPESMLDHILTAFGAPNPNDDTCVVAIQIE